MIAYIWLLILENDLNQGCGCLIHPHMSSSGSHLLLLICDHEDDQDNHQHRRPYTTLTT